MATYAAKNASEHSVSVLARSTRTAAIGAVAGIGASLAMAMYAMIAAATYQNSGFFTPLYHIASTLIAPDAMMTSMERAMSGSNFYFTLGPAIVGAVIHMTVGAAYGVILALIARAAKLHGAGLIAAGAVYGLIVFAVSTWIGLPLAAAIFSAGDPISNMASMVGYPTFITEHVLFGLVVAAILLPAARRNWGRS
ncbi:hypothetical protein [Rhodococcus sp. WMMA185]|uniref:hypothetical protein n=1 Tax=Rhodococcus sp. WMMA185 TaxID=679318 RepID=UPI001E5A849F|nr:hypothetical protein [Rhodococcus sp. WMMA185]